MAPGASEAIAAASAASGASEVIAAVSHFGAQTWAMIACLLTALTAVGSAIKRYYEIRKLRAEAQARVQQVIDEKLLVRVPTPDEITSAIQSFSTYSRLRADLPENQRPDRTGGGIHPGITVEQMVHGMIRNVPPVFGPLQQRTVVNWYRIAAGSAAVFLIASGVYFVIGV